MAFAGITMVTAVCHQAGGRLIQAEITLNVVASSLDTAGRKRMAKNCKETDLLWAP